MLFSKDFLSVLGYMSCNYDHYGTFGRQLDPWKDHLTEPLPDEIKRLWDWKSPPEHWFFSKPIQNYPSIRGNTAHLGSKMRQLSQSEKTKGELLLQPQRHYGGGEEGYHFDH